MHRIEKKTKKIIAALAVITGFAIAILGYITVGTSPVLDDYFFFGIMAAITPLIVVDYLDFQWQKSIDQHLPDLFRSLVQATEVGMTLPQALDDAAQRDFGSLTPELKKMTVQMSWGCNFEDALTAFGRRARTRLMQRITPLILEASRSGGQVEKVFEPMGKFIQSNNLMEKDRRTQTRPYVIIVYVALFVFLFTIVLLFKTFFASAGGVPLMSSQATSPEDMKRIFFHMTLIQGFFGGLAAGKMGIGSVTAGLKHSLVMMLIGFVSVKMFM